MISPELIRRYPFFVGLSHENIVLLANLGQELSVPEGHMFFSEGDEIQELYITVEGAVGIVIDVPQRGADHAVSEQLTHAYATEGIVMSTAGPGQVFGWSGLVSPFETFAGAKALTPCRVISFDCAELRKAFAADCQFGYVMMENTARVVRQRLRDLRIESLAMAAEK